MNTARDLAWLDQPHQPWVRLASR